MLKGNKDGLFFLAQRRQDAKKNKQIFLRLCFLLSLREISYPFYSLFLFEIRETAFKIS